MRRLIEFHHFASPEKRRHRLRWLLMLLFILAVLALMIRALAAGETQAAWSLFSPGGEKQVRLRDNDALGFIRDIYEMISPAVVGVIAVSETQPQQNAGELQIGSGSGLIFSADGYIITNYHVVANARELSVSLADGRIAEASLVGAEPAGDLALLKVELTGLPTARFGDSDALCVGDVVFPIGNPGGEQFARSMTMGLISGIDRQMLLADGNLYSLLQTDAAINPGNSGGPLVNCDGEVIGVNSAKIVDADFEGMGFAIPINTVRVFIDATLPEAAGQ